VQSVQITTSAQAAQRDADAIASGIDSWVLMLAAGTVAAQRIVERYSNELKSGVAIYAGRGNNGGDAYVIAARFIEAGARVTLHAVGTPRTADAKRASAFYESALAARTDHGSVPALELESCGLIIDGILGTGQQGPLRDAERAACVAINAHDTHAIVVALDVPTGVNATTGEIAPDAVSAHCTIAFGTMKRAHVLQRQCMGTVQVVDIGLGAFGNKPDGAWQFVDEPLVRALLPAIAWNAYKGTRGKLAIVGGSDGMAGAIVLASRAALHAGAGLVYAHTTQASMNALQIAVPQVVARTWKQLPEGMNAAALGPGFGRDVRSEQTLHAMLDATRAVPTVIDADALTLLATHTGSDDSGAFDETLTHLSAADQTIARLQHIVSTRPAVCTPHVGEFARLIDTKVSDTIEGRVAQVTAFANATGAVILLKGTPTIVVAPNSAAPAVVARGTAVLATGGSGDLLTGLIGAVLGQGASPQNAAIIGAWVHGRAAEIATALAGTARGPTLDDVLASLVLVWKELEHPKAMPAGVLAELPSVAL
jgi:hydroxyethylthiazole kinase-like uncharacterized protein yjeF